MANDSHLKKVVPGLGNSGLTSTGIHCDPTYHTYQLSTWTRKSGARDLPLDCSPLN